MRYAVPFSCVLLVLGCSAEATSNADAGSDATDGRADQCQPYECFGTFSCTDGLVTEWQAGAIPCGQPGVCRSNDYVRCKRGCRTDGVTTATIMTDLLMLCEEGRPKAAGDRCASDEECLPAGDAGALRCDRDASLCASSDAATDG